MIVEIESKRTADSRFTAYLFKCPECKKTVEITENSRDYFYSGRCCRVWMLQREVKYYAVDVEERQ